MAVSVGDLAVAIRLASSPDETLEAGQAAILGRLLGVAQAYLALYAPDAPDTVAEAAQMRFSAYLFDAPVVARRDAYAHAWVNSGAAALLSPWTPQHTAGGTGRLSAPVDTAV